MASIWDDFKLGAAGLSDLVGITDGLAAEVAVEQAADAAGVTDPERIETARASAIQQQREEDVVRKAAGNTIQHGVDVAKKAADVVGDGVKFVADTASKLLSPLALGLGVTAAVLGVVFVVVKADGMPKRRKASK